MHFLHKCLVVITNASTLVIWIVWQWIGHIWKGWLRQLWIFCASYGFHVCYERRPSGHLAGWRVKTIWKFASQSSRWSVELWTGELIKRWLSVLMTSCVMWRGIKVLCLWFFVIACSLSGTAFTGAQTQYNSWCSLVLGCAQLRLVCPEMKSPGVSESVGV